MARLLFSHLAILGTLGLQSSAAEVFSKAGTYPEGAVPISVPTFVSILTAVVAVISLAIAVFGVLSLWSGYKIREYVSFFAQ